MLGMCPTLAVTTSALNGLGMGVATMAVLIMSNLIISLLRKIIPGGVRMPVYIVIIASFVTIVEMLMLAPGAFLVLSMLCALMNKITKGKKKEAKTKCSGDCINCPQAEKEGK